jgi:hypothetical protein
VTKRLNQERLDGQADYSGLMRDLSEYKACYTDTRGYELVDYGTSQIRLDDAVTRTQKDLDLTQQRLGLIDQQILRFPVEFKLAQIFVDKYGPLYDNKDKGATPALSPDTTATTNTTTNQKTNPKTTPNTTPNITPAPAKQGGK